MHGRERVAVSKEHTAHTHSILIHYTRAVVNCRNARDVRQSEDGIGSSNAAEETACVKEQHQLYSPTTVLRALTEEEERDAASTRV